MVVARSQIGWYVAMVAIRKEITLCAEISDFHSISWISQTEAESRVALNIDSRGGLGYIVSGRYIFVPPAGTFLLRRL